MQTQAKELCGKEIVIHHDLYPEYTIFVYDAVMTVAYGLHAVLKSKPDATFAYPNRCGMSPRTKEERTLLYHSILNVTFDGMSGKVSFKPGVGDRVPAKMEIVNIFVSPVSPFSQAERRDYRHRRRRVHQQHQLPLRNRQRASLAGRRHGGSDRPKRQRGGVSGAVHDADAAVDVDRVYLRSDAGAMADSPPARERRGRGVWNHRGRADPVHGQRGELGRRRGGDSTRRRRCSTRKHSL